MSGVESASVGTHPISKVRPEPLKTKAVVAFRVDCLGPLPLLFLDPIILLPIGEPPVQEFCPLRAARRNRG